jgi:hypothetical protein
MANSKPAYLAAIREYRQIGAPTAKEQHVLNIAWALIGVSHYVVNLSRLKNQRADKGGPHTFYTFVCNAISHISIHYKTTTSSYNSNMI